VERGFDKDTLFSGVGFELRAGERVGLVGPNGAGKTTLFRMIAGEEQPDDGQVTVEAGMTIGYFSQDVGEMSGQSAVAAVMDGVGPVSALATEMAKLEAAMVDPNQAGVDVRSNLLRMDAFIIKGGRAVYLTSRSDVLQGALKGWALHEHILATIIWHEMAHIEGADEVEAQRREEALLTEYIVAERVDRVEAMRYLVTLKGRRGRDGKLMQGNVEETVKPRALEHPIAVIECIKPSCDS
jgi:energy-coupling factor transporter ATP-binding protein EcfA2